MRTLLGSFIVLLTLTSVSDAMVYAEWGGAYNHPGAKQISAVKYAEFGYQENRGKLAASTGFGGWVDNTGYKIGSGIKVNGHELDYKAESSYYVNVLMGVEPSSDHLYISYKLGPAIITNTDALLGSNLQLQHVMEIGMRDSKEVRVGLVLIHFSNGGLVRPNRGRDFVGMKIAF